MATTDLGTVEIDNGENSKNEDNMSNNNDNDNDYENDQRDAWSGRVTFWLAAVGSAVGLGNLWRFPWQCAKYGGGAFIFAYFVALATLGMPLLTQELVLGQKHRSGDIEAFGRMNWRLRGIGLASVIGGFGIVTYYMMIIGTSTVFFFESFMVPLPYEGDNGPSYYLKILNLAGNIDESDGIIGGKLYLATCLCWALTFFCIMKGVLYYPCTLSNIHIYIYIYPGVKTASWAVKVTMPLPFLLLFILLIKAATLDGSWRGVKEYFDFSNWSELGSTNVWTAAIGQCFFSLSVCMGVMTAYGSYNPKKQDIATDEKVIAFLDVAASLMSGFVVYSILGYLTVTQPLEDGGSWFDSASVGLVFSAFPVAIATFNSASNFFGIIFYLTLMLLGIDSAFSIVEAISTVIADSDLNKYKLKWSRTKISAIICICGAFGSSLYCFDTGLFWLDLIDHYINEYGMIFLGICESTAVGWFYRYDLITNNIGQISANLYRCGFFFSLIMACFLSFSLATPEQTQPGGDYIFTGTLGKDSWIVGFIVGLILWFITILISYLQISDYAKQNLTKLEILWYIMGWENVEVLRDFMNKNGLGDKEWMTIKHTKEGEGKALIHHSTVGIWWGFFIKYWLPTILTIVLIGTMRQDRWNPYGGYSWGYQSVGIIIFSSMVLIVVIVAIFPQWMTQQVDETEEFFDKDYNDKTNNNDDNDDEKKKLVDTTNKEKTMQEIYDQYDNNKKEEIELVSEDKPEKASENQVEEEEEEQEKPKQDKTDDNKEENDKDEDYVKVEDDNNDNNDNNDNKDVEKEKDDKPKEEEEKPKKEEEEEAKPEADKSNDYMD